MHDGGQVLEFPPQAKDLQARLEATQLALAVQESQADLNGWQAQLLGSCLKNALGSARLHMTGLCTVPIGLRESHADRFNLNGELLALANYGLNLINSVRAVYELDRLQMPDISEELGRRKVANGACVQPDACTCRQCQAIDSRDCGNE